MPKVKKSEEQSLAEIIYDEIDMECMSDTDVVKMEHVEKILEKHLKVVKEKTHLGSCSMFADRNSDTTAAMEYATQLAQATDSPPAVMTAIYVCHNTFVNWLLENHHIVKKDG